MSGAGRRLIGRGSVYTLGSAAPMLAGLLVTPFLTRAAGVDEYGLISVSITTMQWSLVVLTLGLPLIITRHVLAESTGTEGARGLVLVGTVAALSTAVVVAALLHVVALGGSATSLAVSLALVAGGLGAGIALTQAWAVALERAWFYVVLAAGPTLLAPAAGLLAVGAGEQPSAGRYFAAVAVVNALTLAFGLVKVLGSGRVVLRWNDVTAAVRTSLPLVPHQFVTASANGVGVLVAAAVLGRSDGGRAQVALYLGTVALTLTSAVAYAWLPVLAKGARETRGEQLGETAALVTTLAALATGGVALLSPWLLAVLVPASFSVGDMVPLVAAACLAAPLAAVYLAHYQLVVLSGRTAVLAVLSPLAMLVGAAVSVLATRSLGLAGVGLGVATTYACLWLLVRSLARRVGGVTWPEATVLAPLLVGLVLCLAGALLPSSGIAAAATRGPFALLVAAAGVAVLHRLFGRRGTVDAVVAEPSEGAS
ncbi:Membrane protein involved in the export of O-antigen and teichoic acid [Nocardioides alpinus]|uniref:Membrane protein involved in the export of O-antigen and teichoic acid n=1 Tax=Nocardioides alpinus TaxID=748909 RepID=A0A1I0WGZ5_9ACTN|nr:oligosaccharide flippase family protein [Nocardioides alpinus]PKH37931.1 hypothetical protein CXG46_21350 [Nocardioides alpinus]SFA88055.1 Membrane protein involved in the export of O-antigen and teichoic acid [Nocardioides alpinus]